MKTKIVKSYENSRLFGSRKLNFDIRTIQTIPTSLNSGWVGNHFMERAENSEHEVGNTWVSFNIDALGGYFNENE